PDFANILDADRHAVTRCDGDFLDLCKRFDAATGAYDEAFSVSFDGVGTDAAVIRFQRSHDIVEGNPVGCEPGRIGLDVELLDVAPDGVGPRHARNAPHLRPND